MPIRITTPNASRSFKTHVEKESEQLAKIVCANVLSYVGLKGVTEARDHGSYTDQSGNLRSSIREVVTVGGKVVSECEEKQYKEGTEGLRKGKELIDKFSKKREGDIALHIVAGMDYADYVERIHHKNVLSSARVLMDARVPQQLQMSGIKLTKK